MGFLDGKKLLITGVLSNRSIAYGIAKACRQQGAELAFSYVGERFKGRTTDFAAEFDSKLIFDCDVGDDAQIERMFADLSQTWSQFDGFVHAIGFAPREAIAGNFFDGLSRENYRIAHDISAYSFPGMAKAALPFLSDRASLLTLSYLGALRSIPNYNTMGLAKASLEASVRYMAEALGNKGVRVNG
ncbi:MAG: SDR family oxidoreductase, partial [Comamonadaceae bacterium]